MQKLLPALRVLVVNCVGKVKKGSYPYNGQKTKSTLQSQSTGYLCFEQQEEGPILDAVPCG
eukprot:3595084-Amphidinium_carterae.1